MFSKVDKNILKEQTKQKNRYDNCLPKVHRFAVSVLLQILYLPPASYISGMHMFIYILSCFCRLVTQYLSKTHSNLHGKVGNWTASG